MRGENAPGGGRPIERPAAAQEEADFEELLSRKASKRREGRGTPAGIIRRPIEEPPMRNVKDAGDVPFDSDEDYEIDELLGDELAKVEEQIG